LPEPAPPSPRPAPPDPREPPFLRAARRLPVGVTPVWFMRQAGRAIPDYRRVRERHSVVEIARTPELAAEVALQPVRTLGVDAAILFADIMLPVQAMGVALDLVERVGPVIDRPIRTPADVRALRPLEPREGVPFVLETIRLLNAELGGRVPVIGFAGAPFTLASYLVEGRPTRDYARVKAMMFSAPDLWHALMDRLAGAMLAYLKAQAEAGAAALQVFDSWVGALSPRDYREFVLPHNRRIFAGLAAAGVPLIHFGTGTATLLELQREAGGDVIGVDWRIPLDRAWARVGYDRAVQGNLDPGLLLAPPEVLAERAREVLRAAGGRPGHIFNLGHGVLPGAPVESLQRLVEVVHAFRPGEDGPRERPDPSTQPEEATP
jgi:uroporphyrinogen decarboxylase